MATLAQIGSGLDTRLATITGLDHYAEEPGSFACPAAWPLPRENDYHETFIGTELLTVDIFIIAAPVDGVLRAEGQKTLDLYLSKSGTKSIRAAIEDDATLGGVVHTLSVVGWRHRGHVEVNGAAYWGGRVEVQIWN